VTRTRIPEAVLDAAHERSRARAARDFDTADRLRGEIEAAGWEMRDEPGGYRLVRRR
jgi:cysteinyl-tRNA synthetase